MHKAIDYSLILALANTPAPILQILLFSNTRGAMGKAMVELNISKQRKEKAWKRDLL